MSELFIFILKLVALLGLIIIEDYVLWRLSVCRRREVSLPSLTLPSDEFLNQQSNPNAYDTTDKQTINKNIIAEELDNRTNEPEDENNDCYANNTQTYEQYRLFIGLRHIPYLSKAYSSLIIKRVATKCK